MTTQGLRQQFLASARTVRGLKRQQRATVLIVLDKTAFYAESGGQVGDTGVITTDGGKAVVLDTKKRNGKFLHIAKVESGVIKAGDSAVTEIDNERRSAIEEEITQRLTFCSKLSATYSATCCSVGLVC